jgi:hypothetical protein
MNPNAPETNHGQLVAYYNGNFHLRQKFGAKQSSQ